MSSFIDFKKKTIKRTSKSPKTKTFKNNIYKKRSNSKSKSRMDIEGEKSVPENIFINIGRKNSKTRTKRISSKINYSRKQRSQILKSKRLNIMDDIDNDEKKFYSKRESIYEEIKKINDTIKDYETKLTKLKRILEDNKFEYDKLSSDHYFTTDMLTQKKISFEYQDMNIRYLLRSGQINILHLNNKGPPTATYGEFDYKYDIIKYKKTIEEMKNLDKKIKSLEYKMYEIEKDNKIVINEIITIERKKNQENEKIEKKKKELEKIENEIHSIEEEKRNQEAKKQAEELRRMAKEEEAEKKRREEEAEKKRREEEAEKKRREEEAEKKRREEAEKKQREEAEKKQREEAEKKQREEEARKQREEEARKQREAEKKRREETKEKTKTLVKETNDKQIQQNINNACPPPIGPTPEINPITPKSKIDYYKQTRFFHPDKNPECTETANEKIQILNNLWEKEKNILGII
jgi:hypothetical protein